MRRITRLVLALAVTAISLFGFVTPAQATCTRPIEELPCIERVVCQVVNLVRPADCIQ